MVDSREAAFYFVRLLLNGPGPTMSENEWLIYRLPRELRAWKSRVQMPKQTFKRANRSQSARRPRNSVEQSFGTLPERLVGRAGVPKWCWFLLL